MMDTLDSNAAPLEQNIKNLECDGTAYKIIREEPKRAHSVSLVLFIAFLQQLAISPSIKAIKRNLGGKSKKMSIMTENDFFAVNTGLNSAI